MRKRTPLVVILALLWGMAYYFNSYSVTHSASSQSEEALPYVNFKAPPFSLHGLDGKHYALSAVKGKPVVLNFWASWCGPCNIEAPELSQMAQKHKGAFVLYAVNLTKSESSLNDVNQFVKKYDFQFPVLLDKRGTVSKLYQIRPIPTTFFINSKGVIVDKVIGYGGEGVLEAKLTHLLQSEGRK